MPENTDIDTIRKAIEKNRGGWEKASPDALLRIWRSLDEATQTLYLESLQEKATTADHDRTGPKSDV